ARVPNETSSHITERAKVVGTITRDRHRWCDDRPLPLPPLVTPRELPRHLAATMPLVLVAERLPMQRGASQVASGPARGPHRGKPLATLRLPQQREVEVLHRLRHCTVAHP